MKVIIFSEGGKGIGLGHIARCCALYDAFEEKKTLPELIIDSDKSVQSLLKNKRYRIFNWLEEYNRFLELIQEKDVVIIDSYLAGLDYYQSVSKMVKTPIYIDDNKRLNYPEGIVINGNIYAQGLNYPKREKVTYLLGTDFTPLRKEFWRVPKKKIRKKINSVMITFGGDDVRNMTVKVLKMLTKSYPKVIKKVVVTGGPNQREEILKNKDSQTKLIPFKNSEDIKKIMLETDLAISAAGQTLYELARTGTPTVAVATYNNQLSNMKGWKDVGFIDQLLYHDTKDLLTKMTKSIDKLSSYFIRNQRSNKIRDIIDGKGARRIAQLVMEYQTTK